MQVNRRKHQRTSANLEPCVVSVDQVHMEGEIIDESVAGLGIAGLDLFMMPFNKPVVVNRREGSVTANVRHVRRECDHRFNVGVIRQSELTADEAAEDSAMLINCYVQHQKWMVLCMPISVEGDRVKVQLWDGMNFQVLRKDLVAMTRQERFDMLADPAHLATALEMYKFDGSGSESSRFNVFDHEFGYFKDCPISNQRHQLTSV